MKQWENPNIYILSGSATEAGNKGKTLDGVIYDLGEAGFFGGTSGPAVNYPVVNVVDSVTP